MPADFTSGVFVGERAWHGQGRVVDVAPKTWTEARELALPEPLTWDVVESQVYEADVQFTDDGEPITTYRPVEGYKRFVRSDTGATLHVAKESLALITLADMTEVSDALFAEPNVEITALVALSGGRRVATTVRLDEPFQVNGDPSETYPYGCVLNSFDASAAFSVTRSTFRVVCNNTFSAAEGEASRHGFAFSFRHTTNWRERVDEAKAAINGVRSEAGKWKEIADALTLLPVRPGSVSQFLSEFLPMPPQGLATDRVVENVETARAAYEAILAGPTCEGIRDNAYGLVQAAGEYLDHRRRARSWETKLNRQLLRPEPLKAKAVKLAREVCAA